MTAPLRAPADRGGEHDGGGPGKGGTVTLYSGSERLGDGRVERTIPFLFSFDETLDIGVDLTSPVSPTTGRPATSSRAAPEPVFSMQRRPRI